ncbi:MAG: O-antigen ligase family protein [bacterium]
MKRDAVLKILGIEMGVFIGLVPILVLYGFMDPFGTIKRTVAETIICIMGVTVAWGWYSGRIKEKLCPGHFLLIIYIAIGIVSLTGAPDKYAGIYRVLLVADWFVVTVAGYYLLRDRESVIGLLRWLAISGCAVGLVGIYETAAGSSPFINTAIFEGRVSSTFGIPTLFAGYILLIIFLMQGGFFVSRGAKEKALYGFVWIIMIVNLYYNRTLTAWASFILTEIYLVVRYFYVVRKNKKTVSMSRVIILFAAAAAVLFLAWSVLHFKGNDGSPRNRYDVLMREKGRSIQLRLQRWEAALEMIGDRPLKGVGTGQFVVYYPLYKAENGSHRQDAADVSFPENLLLLIFAETGVFGFLALTGVFAWTYMIMKRAISSGESWRRCAVFAFGCGAIALLLYAMFHYPLHTHGVWGVFWVCVSAVWGLGLSPAKERADVKPERGCPKEKKRILKGSLLFFCVLLGGCVFACSAGQLLKEYYFYSALGSGEQGKYEDAERHVVKALRLTCNKDWRLHKLHGEILLKEKRREESFSAFRNASRLRPNNVSLYYYMYSALSMNRKRNDEKIIETLDSIIKVAPHSDRPHMIKAVQHASMGRYGHAVSSMLSFLNYNDNPTWEEYYTLLLYMGKLSKRNKALEKEILWRVISMNPEGPMPYYHMGLIMFDEGDNANAEEMFRRALLEDPNFKEAAEGIERLGGIP